MRAHEPATRVAAATAVRSAAAATAIAAAALSSPCKSAAWVPRRHAAIGALSVPGGRRARGGPEVGGGLGWPRGGAGSIAVRSGAKPRQRRMLERRRRLERRRQLGWRTWRARWARWAWGARRAWRARRTSNKCDKPAAGRHRTILLASASYPRCARKSNRLTAVGARALHMLGAKRLCRLGRAAVYVVPFRLPGHRRLYPL